MKKDKVWLLEKHRECIQSPKTGEKMLDEGYELALNDMLIYIDQLDEPEITLDKAFEKVAETHSLTKEQIARHLEKLETCGGKVIYGEPEMSMTLINAQQPLDKIEEYMVKPVLPQFVFCPWCGEELKLR